jgi:hypothetical protein
MSADARAFSSTKSAQRPWGRGCIRSLYGFNNVIICRCSLQYQDNALSPRIKTDWKGLTEAFHHANISTSIAFSRGGGRLLFWDNCYHCKTIRDFRWLTSNNKIVVLAQWLTKYGIVACIVQYKKYYCTIDIA